MKTFSKNTKAFIMKAAMVVLLLLPTTIKAQGSIDGFFSSSNTDDYKSRTSFCDNVTNQTFGDNFGFTFGTNYPQPQNDSPVGSGLLIMTIAGASYVLLKKKEN